MRTHPIVVVGGGVIGLMTARALARHGHEVVVFERGALGREASWAAGGILSPLYPWRYPDAVTRLSQASQAVYPELCKGLEEATGIDPEWEPSGLWCLGEGERDHATAWAARFGVRLEVDAGGEWGPGLWLPDVAQVRPPRRLRALRGQLQTLPVTIREEACVEGLRWQRGVLTGLVVNGEEVAASRLVVAAGPWSAPLLARYGLPLPVTPVKGQMILIQAPRGALKTMVLKEGRYLVPRRDGSVLVGSTQETQGFDKTLTEEARVALRASALALWPALEPFPVTHQWAGLRPSSPEGVPFIGEHPEIRGCFVNTGHFRNGIVLAPASAELAADLVLCEDPGCDPAPYAPDRSLGGGSAVSVVK